ncbi:MAG: phosphoadenylyl-sulfate reductase [Elusimicrobia bacterium]|nr:phosphoadenylyl-sulfate reductase [Elusimicrobiota bacterium]
MNVTPEVIEELGSLTDPAVLLKTLQERFGGRLAIGTAGQLTESVLVALCVEAGFKPRVFTVDTERLFPETLDHFAQLEKNYGLTIERFHPDPKAVASMVSDHGEFLFFDSKEKQELCCRVRKVFPNERALRGLDVWVTGLRSDQSPSRQRTPRLEMIMREEDGKKRSILKVSPLADWTESRVWDYVRTHAVPVNELMAKKNPGGWRYESLGCVICTTPIGPNEPRRAGRWRWFNQDVLKECGLHLPPPPHG